MGEIYESVGPRRYLDRFLAEYNLREEHVRDRIKVDTPEPWLSGATPEEEYLVHESLLRSHGEFPCPGDNEATCLLPGDRRGDGACLRHRSRRGGGTYQPAMVQTRSVGPRTAHLDLGLDLAYHQMPDDWAGDIYFGEGSRWWHRRHTLSRYHRPDRQHGQDGA